MYTLSLTIFIKLDLQNYKRSMENLFYEHQNLAFSFFLQLYWDREKHSLIFIFY